MLSLIANVIKLILMVLGLIKDSKDPGQHVTEVHEAVKATKEAKTDEEKDAALKKWQDILAGK